jgi:hypothetical protein
MTFALLRSYPIHSYQDHWTIILCSRFQLLYYVGLIGGLCDLACTRAPTHPLKTHYDSVVDGWNGPQLSSQKSHHHPSGCGPLWLDIWTGTQWKNVILYTHHPSSYMVCTGDSRNCLVCLLHTLYKEKLFISFLIGTWNHQFRWILDFSFHHHHLLVHRISSLIIQDGLPSRQCVRCR